jgi:hypothetical protein
LLTIGGGTATLNARRYLMNEPEFDLSELHELQSDAMLNRGNFGCVRKLLHDHPDDAEYITYVLGQDNVYASVIAELLQRKGFEIGEDAIRRHRRGKCKCR